MMQLFQFFGSESNENYGSIKIFFGRTSNKNDVTVSIFLEDK
jgi:hypothetical protein